MDVYEPRETHLPVWVRVRFFDVYVGDIRWELAPVTSIRCTLAFPYGCSMGNIKEGFGCCGGYDYGRGR